MTEKKGHRKSIPIKFADQPASQQESESIEAAPEIADGIESQLDSARSTDEAQVVCSDEAPCDQDAVEEGAPQASEETPSAVEAAGPVMAELIAARAELRRVEGELAKFKREREELRDLLARRQAEFENFRKRLERERAETYQRVVGEVVSQLFPVLDNLRRALEAERSAAAEESAEFRHFLAGVELISKQLDGILENFGIKPVATIGRQFDPHFHEAIATEPTDEVEPNTIIEEIVRGYTLGDKLLRPAMVKVAIKQ